MKFKIINRENKDYFMIEGEEIRELRKKAIVGATIRGWADCYSEII